MTSPKVVTPLNYNIEISGAKLDTDISAEEIDVSKTKILPLKNVEFEAGSPASFTIETRTAKDIRTYYWDT